VGASAGFLGQVKPQTSRLPVILVADLDNFKSTQVFPTNNLSDGVTPSPTVSHLTSPHLTESGNSCCCDNGARESVRWSEMV